MIPKRKLGRHGPEVTALGFGCMGLKWLGEAVAPFRDQVVIATKFGFKGGTPAAGTDSRPERIREVADASLRQLKTDRIDLFDQQYSLWWREPEKEMMPLLEKLGIGFVPFSVLGARYPEALERMTGR